MLSSFTARQSLCRVACKISVRYHPPHAIQGPSDGLLRIPTQRFFARTTPIRPLIFASKASDPGQTPLEFLSLILIFPPDPHLPVADLVRPGLRFGVADSDIGQRHVVPPAPLRGKLPHFLGQLFLDNAGLMLAQKIKKIQLVMSVAGLPWTGIWWLWVDSNHRPQHYECRHIHRKQAVSMSWALIYVADLCG